MNEEDSLQALFCNNRTWAERMTAKRPDFFTRLAAVQRPNYLWIGCADSRVPANEITGMLPGEIFVHRNVANLVVPSDLNCLTVMQFAVEVLKVRHIIVCGHYGCGGVKAVLDDTRLGLADHWLSPIQDIRRRHNAALSTLPDDAARWRRLCELNVSAQVANVCRTTIVADAWTRRQGLTIHGLIYGLEDGLLRELHPPISGPPERYA